MTKRDFFEWLEHNGCEVRPRAGVNNTTPVIEAVNRKTGRYSFFYLLPNEPKVARMIVEKLIRDLGIEPPKLF